jgi:hypothetical protein
MVRTIIKPNAPKINLSIPDEYIGEEVEILVFPVKKADSMEKSTNKFDPSTKAVPVFGCMKGQIKMSADFDEPLEDFKEYM